MQLSARKAKPPNIDSKKTHPKNLSCCRCCSTKYQKLNFSFFFILGPIRQACNEGECDKKTSLQQRHAKPTNDSREHQKVTEPHGLAARGPHSLGWGPSSAELESAVTQRRGRWIREREWERQRDGEFRKEKNENLEN